MSQVMYKLSILMGLLNYHKRMMVGLKAGCKEKDESKCLIHCDGYEEALEEAIRCVEIVHKDELLSS